MYRDERFTGAQLRMRSGRYLHPTIVRQAERWLLVLPEATSSGLKSFVDDIATMQASNLMFRPIFLVPSDASTRCLTAYAFQYETLFVGDQVTAVTGMRPEHYLTVRIREVRELYNPRVVHLLRGQEPAGLPAP